MSDAPERIGLVFYRNGEVETYKDSFQPNPTVYVRADRIAELERREACAADLAREWEHHCKTAEASIAALEAEVARLRAALEGE